MSEKIIVVIETSEWVDVPEVAKAIDSYFGKNIVISVKDAAQQPRVLDFCPACLNTGYRRVSPSILANCSCKHGQSQ